MFGARDIDTDDVDDKTVVLIAKNRVFHQSHVFVGPLIPPSTQADVQSCRVVRYSKYRFFFVRWLKCQF